MSSMRRWRGLAALVRDAALNASLAIERVHKETARRPFDVLERVPPLAAPVRGIHAIHDATVATVHGAIRLVSRAVAGTVDVVLGAAEGSDPDRPPRG